MGGNCSCLNSASTTNMEKAEKKNEVNSSVHHENVEGEHNHQEINLGQDTKAEHLNASRIQAVARGHLVRKELEKPLFEIRDARTWFKVEDHYKPVDKPITKIQSKEVGSLEKNLTPFKPEKVDDGVPVKAKPAVTLENGAVYEGEWDKQGNQHGVGTMVTKDGSKIIGSFSAGIVQGLARMIQNTGLVLEGEFKNGKLNGNGKIQGKSGAKFEGALADGEMHGNGAEEWPDGIKYDGEYKKGMKHGKGKLEIPDKGVYTGGFKKNMFDGKGEFIYNNGTSYKGGWKEGKINGKGVFKWADGREYEGEFKDELRHGKGKMVWPDGRVYVGGWVEGKQHGEAEYTFKGKDSSLVTKKGVWEDGNRVNWL